MIHPDLFYTVLLAIISFKLGEKLWYRWLYSYRYKVGSTAVMQPGITSRKKIAYVEHEVQILQYVDLEDIPDGLVGEWEKYCKENQYSPRIQINSKDMIPADCWFNFLQQRG